MLGSVITVALVTLTATAGAHSDVTTEWTGDRIVETLRTRRLSLNGANVTGDLDFRRFDVVQRPFSCRNCTINGRVLANDVAFNATLDLSGAQISGAVLAQRATFRGPVLFGPTSPDQPTRFARGVDFSFTRFEDLASFAGASFLRSVEFATARFGPAPIFADATFERRAVFERAVFSSGADFRASLFSGAARFSAAQFDARADFSNTTFEGPADFDGTRFGLDGTFLGTLFTYTGGTSGVTFGGAISERDFVFDLAEFQGGGNFRQTVAGGVLSFDGALMSTRKPLVFDRASAQGIAMDVDDALAVVEPGDRTRVLRLIEARAKERGDLGVANDARFSLEVLKSRDDPWHRRIPNAIFYRLIAGYFVRPLHPLLTLLLLAGLVSFVRVVRGTGSSRFWRRTWSSLSGFGQEFLDSLALIGRGGGSNGRGGRRLEAFVYRALVLCALIGLGNSNPTLREMFDAVV